MESNVRICKKCNQLKNRIEAGKFPNGKDKKWADESGKLWNGSVCGGCTVIKAKETMKVLRDKKLREQI